jgi:hypothetical protein
VDSSALVLELRKQGNQIERLQGAKGALEALQHLEVHGPGTLKAVSKTASHVDRAQEEDHAEGPILHDR